MSGPELTIPEAANLARTISENVRGALAAGELRDLTIPAVKAWSRGLTARITAEGMRLGGVAR